MATTSRGTTLKFTPSSGTQVTVGKLTSIGEVQPEAEEIDITTLESTGGYREYMRGYLDAGEVELEGFFDASDAGQSALRAAFSSGATGAFLVTFPDGTTVAFNGFVKAHSIGSAEVDGAIGFGATIRITGAITVTEATGSGQTN